MKRSSLSLFQRDYNQVFQNASSIIFSDICKPLVMRENNRRAFMAISAQNDKSGEQTGNARGWLVARPA
jgi:hypothetical protein